MKRVPMAALMLLAASVVLLLGLGRTDTYNPDEPRELEMAREMHAGGDFVTPRLNGEPFLEKPPLFYWLVVGASRLAGGVAETPARSVPAIAGILTVLLTYLMARRLFGERTAVLAALVLLTSFEFFYISRRAMIDMPLTLATTAACFGFHRAMTTTGRGRRGAIALGIAALAAALMFKGVVGAGLPGLAIVAWLVARRDWSGFLRHGLVPGAVLALVPVGLWVLALRDRLGDGAVREFVLVNNVLRFTGGAAKGHDNPFWYYLPTILTDLTPWSVVLPFALVAALGAAARRRPEIRDLVLWFGLPLVVLSIASTKRGIYLLPIYPPAAMLVAWWLTGAGGRDAGETVDGEAPSGAGSAATPPAAEPTAPRPGRRVAAWCLFAALVVLVIAVLSLGLAARPDDRIAPALLGLLLAWPVTTAWRAARSGDDRWLGLGVAGGSAVVFVAAMAWAVPALVNRGVSARPAGEELRALAEAGDRIALYRFHQGMMGGFLFYSGRTYPSLRDGEDLLRHLEADSGDTGGASDIGGADEAGGGDTNGAGGGRALVLMRVRDFDEAVRTLPFPIVEARRFVFPKFRGVTAASGDYVLVTRPALAGGVSEPP